MRSQKSNSLWTLCICVYKCICMYVYVTNLTNHRTLPSYYRHEIKEFACVWLTSTITMNYICDNVCTSGLCKTLALVGLNSTANVCCHYCFICWREVQVDFYSAKWLEDAPWSPSALSWLVDRETPSAGFLPPCRATVSLINGVQVLDTQQRGQTFLHRSQLKGSYAVQSIQQKTIHCTEVTGSSSKKINK